MSQSPFPALHTRANESAARKAEGARAACERADQLLGEIDSLISAREPVAASGTRRPAVQAA